MKCSLCKIVGHSKRSCPTLKCEATQPETPLPSTTKKTASKPIVDNYTEDVLRMRYESHKKYVVETIEIKNQIGINIRLPCIPEDISENIVKHILRNKLGDPTSTWMCQTGDLHSETEGTQECKCFTSDGPLSFSPTSDWDVIYFLDARRWLDDFYILYRIPLKKTSTDWQNLNMNSTQTFGDQSRQGRRPRITWEGLKSQIEGHCEKIYEGLFNDIFAL